MKPFEKKLKMFGLEFRKIIEECKEYNCQKWGNIKLFR